MTLTCRISEGCSSPLYEYPRGLNREAHELPEQRSVRHELDLRGEEPGG